MPRLPCPRQLQHVGVADEVRLDVGCRVLQAVADAGLRSEMDDAVDVDFVGRAPEQVDEFLRDVVDPILAAEGTSSREPEALRV